ncbi:hypothetical protein AURDEDRAFT_188604 [Auricularia subglabra TFB-10046 SS5]|nr:hypothetical protein AURDEDRAFT_188604 [Auricularia subglabra TFB-10046 SS5]
MPLFLATLLFASVSALILNVTIDDTLGDEQTGQIPLYAPDAWTPRSVGGVPCSECTAQPDGTYVYKATWHDRSTLVHDEVPSTVTMNFYGTRIYVFFILFNNIGTLIKDTRLRFYVDDSSDSNKDFLHTEDPAGDKYLYNQLVFDSQALELANHTLRISSYSTGTYGSIALFDYAVYTTEADDDPASHSSTQSVAQPPSPSSTHVAGPTPSQSDRGQRASRLGVIACSIASALVLALMLAAGYGVYRIRRRRRRGVSASWSITESYRRAAIIDPFIGRLPSQSEAAALDRGAVSQPSPLSSDESARLRGELGWMREELERITGSLNLLTTRM